MTANGYSDKDVLKLCRIISKREMGRIKKKSCKKHN